MFKKLIRVGTIGVLSTLLLSACGSSESGSTISEAPAESDGTGTTFEQIKSSGKLTVGTEAAFEPFEFVKDGKIVGYGKDILDVVVEDLDVELEQLDLPWQGILPGLDAKKFDFVATSVTITPERAEKYDFTIPIADGTMAVLKRKDDSSIKNPEDIAGKVVGTQLGSGQLQSLEKYNEELTANGGGVKEIKEYVGFPEAYQELATGRIDAVINTKANLSGILKQNPDTFEIVDTFGDPVWISWAVRKGDQDLLDYLNKQILELRNLGELAKMQEEWFGFTMDTPDSGYLPK
ncbi:transporter substrate-binding domain-containing protein [Metabacillus sp. B2-18]|uniref:transporter substrate-binding domain-containing protein n=1 Tax=Metabacillus sp. B2-18 TaxID=2897333 RepID=UPI001E37DA21|nr:transporter substrate-binding domain-containing protein [Metabacillus sp. B2-18]UGB33166.1 transporter substrate-binding domain-containing protein [Metabacillus sp. B2-18]